MISARWPCGAVLARVSMRVRRMLTLAGILPLFDLVNSLEEAASAVNST